MLFASLLFILMPVIVLPDLLSKLVTAGIADEDFTYCKAAALRFEKRAYSEHINKPAIHNTKIIYNIMVSIIQKNMYVPPMITSS